MQQYRLQRVGHDWAIFTYSLREGNGTQLQYSCLENPMDGGAWKAAVHDLEGRWGSDMTERLHFDFSLSCIGEGNGNPLHCSCLENPRDGGSWWAAVYGVAQSQTRLKRLSSSSSTHSLTHSLIDSEIKFRWLWGWLVWSTEAQILPGTAYCVYYWRSLFCSFHMGWVHYITKQ